MTSFLIGYNFILHGPAGLLPLRGAILILVPYAELALRAPNYMLRNIVCERIAWRIYHSYVCEDLPLGFTIIMCVKPLRTGFKVRRS